jgi:hypothetical protein
MIRFFRTAVIAPGELGAALGAFEAAMEKLMSDPGYLKILGEAGELFVPGATRDEIWRVV